MHLRKIIFLSALAACLIPVGLSAQDSADELQSKIDARARDIESLTKVIDQYQAEIDALGDQGMSLSKTLAELSLTQKKLQADIARTSGRIDSKNSEIRQLSSKIGKAEGNIADGKLYVSEALRKMNELDDRSIPAIFLSGQSLSDAWSAVNKLGLLESSVTKRVREISYTKKGLETNRKATERAKTELVKLEVQLNGQRKVVIETTKAQQRLLADTKNSEAGYKKLLAEKVALKNEFEREIQLFESQLQLSVDASKLPRMSSILSWPLDSVLVTQYFGNTPFASANPQVYSGNGHNGIDLRASIGTPVKASLAGTVIGSGNTDAIRGCYSLGKWILIKHANGISTLYAHLSVQNVSAGNQVATGQVIGYSGNTGYTTGPHLHFGVYASSGIEIKQFSASRSCRGATIPIAVTKAYLNPLSYLPQGRI